MNDKYIGVKDLNNYIKNLVDNETFLKKIYLKGEISNYKHHNTGHLYFSLKDSESKINAVMFEFNRHKGLDFEPKDGDSILIEGKISVYVPNGAYQIYVEKMTKDGIGNLYIEFEKLKSKLELEGLFKKEHKRALPNYPKKIGIITASTGAAIKDILSTIKRRFPICEAILFPSLVQGEGAKENIVKQIKTANTYNLDLLIVGRGGGSIEDLWAFNEEIVARAIYDSKIPIISAVGHDVDYTISDFVADLRAPTPTGAAEMAVPNIKDIQIYLKQLEIRASKTLKNTLVERKNHLNNIINSYILKNPLALYEVKMQKLSNYIDILNNILEKKVKAKTYEFKNIINHLKLLNPNNNILKTAKYELNLTINKLSLLNPLIILEKGYSIATKNNDVLKTTSKLKKGDIIDIKLKQGNIKAEVKEIYE